MLIPRAAHVCTVKVAAVGDKFSAKDKFIQSSYILLLTRQHVNLLSSQLSCCTHAIQYYDVATKRKRYMRTLSSHILQNCEYLFEKELHRNWWWFFISEFQKPSYIQLFEAYAKSKRDGILFYFVRGVSLATFLLFAIFYSELLPYINNNSNLFEKSL